MKIRSQYTKLFLSFILFSHANFSLASGAIGPAATVSLNFGSQQAAPRIGFGLGLYSVASPAEARMAPLFSLVLGGQKRNQQNIFANTMATASPASPTSKEPKESHTLLYVTGAVVVVTVGALLLTARHNAPPAQGTGGSNPPAQ